MRCNHIWLGKDNSYTCIKCIKKIEMNPEMKTGVLYSAAYTTLFWLLIIMGIYSSKEETIIHLKTQLTKIEWQLKQEQ